MTENRSKKAIIVGGGVGGLAAAATLRKVGLEVEVWERARELRAGTTAVSFMCNAVSAMHTLGIRLEDELAARGRVFESLDFRTRKGRLIRSVDFREFARRQDAPSFAVHRADLQAALLAAAGPDLRIELGAVATGFRITDAGVQVDFADGRRATGDLLIGADGFHSAIRRQLIGTEGVRDGGYVCWLATVPFEHPRFVPGYAAHYWGAGERFGLADIGNGRAYWWGTKNTAPGQSASADVKAEVERVFSGWAPEVPAVIRRTPAESIVTVRAQDRPFRDTWGTGPVTLLGDAAHPMLVSLGQGAAMAVEDAAVLAQQVAAQPDVEQGLRGYEAARIPRTRIMVEASYALSQVEQLEGPIKHRMRALYFKFTRESKFAEQNAGVLMFPAPEPPVLASAR
ncbi:MAG TPA: FAD-dependent monooxygenase [Jatrophihabitans sp.]|nr:FAD-dependent monooxygenase [Jatrophihabitans sp.]